MVKGRKSGKLHTTPITLIEEDGQRWLVAPYGEVNWVRNARAAGEVTLTRGRRSETLPIVELGPEASAPILKKYVTRVPITRPYFTVTPDAPIEAFVAEAARHPVFASVRQYPVAANSFKITWCMGFTDCKKEPKEQSDKELAPTLCRGLTPLPLGP